MSIWEFLNAGKNMDYEVMPDGSIEVFDYMTTRVHFVIPAFIAHTVEV